MVIAVDRVAASRRSRCPGRRRAARRRESLYETLFWLSQAGTREAVAEAREQADAGALYSAEETMARYGVRPR